jgi:hypothetical protein
MMEEMMDMDGDRRGPRGQGGDMMEEFMDGDHIMASMGGTKIMIKMGATMLSASVAASVAAMTLY